MERDFGERFMRRSLFGRGVRRGIVSRSLLGSSRHQCLRCLRVFVHVSTMRRHSDSYSSQQPLHLHCTICRLKCDGAGEYIYVWGGEDDM